MIGLAQNISRRAVLLSILAALILHLVLVQPNHPAAMAWKALLLFPLELPAIVLICITLGSRRTGTAVRVIIVTVLTVIAALKFADFVMFKSLSRGFNPVADFPLITSLYDLTVGTFGQNTARASVIAAILAAIGVFAALWWACRWWSGINPSPKVTLFAGIGAIVSTGLVIADIGAKMGRWSIPDAIPGTAFTARVGVERAVMTRKTIADLRAFRLAARQDPFADQTNLLDLVDRDVFVIFVESYGRTSLDTPFYADLHRQTLQSAQDQLGALGLSMASTLLESPTQGGQSWLAHATFANGLWIDNQTAYGAALRSGRQTLYHVAAQSGFHTAAVMPQITLDWPEAQFMGFDTVLAAKDLGYAGLPLNWVTMPDQFTFVAMDRLIPPKVADDRHLFVQMALGSSHAPWVPVPTLLDWDALGDGTVFNNLVGNSETPREVWKDYDRVRDQYRLAVDYALQVVFAYVALHADDPPLFIVVGDHQAAGFIALDERPHVPMHLIGPAHLVDALTDAGFQPGLLPDDVAQVRPMTDMRAHILQSLTSAQVGQ